MLNRPDSISNQKSSTTKNPRDLLRGNYDAIIGSSPRLLEVLTQIERFTKTPLEVIISGETGTGKELAARALHANSMRSKEAMIVVNCAAIPDELLESHLFGHEAGAFTDAKQQRIGKFEQADNGTLFLDEIAELPLSLQPKLLRALETGEIERVGGTASISVNVRIVAATNRVLDLAIKEGGFRRDLYHRLDGCSIHLPPLRERLEDIPELAEHFVKKAQLETFFIQLPPLRERLSAGDTGQKPHSNSTKQEGKIAWQTLELLKGYAWPGNVRELKKVMLYALILAEGKVILPAHLPKKLHSADGQLSNSGKAIEPVQKQQAVSFPIGLTLKEIEQRYIQETLAQMDGNRTCTAKTLGISPKTLRSKLKTYSGSR